MASLLEGVLGRIFAEGGHGVKRNWSEVYFWYSLAATCDPLKGYVSLRKQAAKNLTSDQIAGIEKRVNEWTPRPTPATLWTQQSQQRVNKLIAALKHQSHE